MFKNKKKIYNSGHSQGRSLILAFLLCFCINVFGQNSVLSSGTWIKVSVQKNGVFKLDKAFFEKYAPLFSNQNPQNIQVFHGNSKVLPQKNSDNRISDLKEVPVWLKSESQTWDKDNFIAFYAQDSHSYLDGKKELNPYSDQNFYFIKIGSEKSKRIETLKSSSSLSAQDFLPFYIFEEKETKNFLNSGRQWFGDFFNSLYTIKPEIDDFYSDLTFSYSVLPLGRASQYLSFSLQNTILKTDTLLGSLYSANDYSTRYYRVANLFSSKIDFKSPFSELKANLRSDGLGAVGLHWDKWSLKYNRLLQFKAKEQLEYFVENKHSNLSFKVQNVQSSTGIWQIKSAFEVFQSQEKFDILEGTKNVFLFDFDYLENPKFEQNIQNQNIKSFPAPELLVVYPQIWKNDIEAFLTWKKENEDLEVLGVSVQEIYNEFSSGKVDVSAIRDFCAHLFKKGNLKYLLLVGDATYDFKNNLKVDYVNLESLVPTYQSRESLEPIFSYASDDYFGFLKENDGEWPEGYSLKNSWISTKENHNLDIAVGRIPVRNLDDFEAYFQKYKNYQRGNWQNRFTFIADNRDWNLHVKEAEKVEGKVAKIGIETSKLYLDDFPLENAVAVKANEKLHELVNQGQFLISYLGHGSEEGLTSEKLLGIQDIFKFNNLNKPAIWFTGTCEFGKFDNPAKVSGAELMLNTLNSGAIALLTTTRPVYASNNQLLNQAFFEKTGQFTTLGEWFKYTKNHSQSGELNRNFTLLGDPSFSLPRWKEELEIEFEKDTLFALEKINFEIKSDKDVYLKIIDKVSQKKTLGSFEDSPAFTYNLNSEWLTSVKVKVENGQGKGSFILPKNEGIGFGRIVFERDGNFGFVNNILISGEEKTNKIDTEKPKIQLLNQTENFIEWTITDDSGLDFRTLKLVINGKEVFEPMQYFDIEKNKLSFSIENFKKGNYSTILVVKDVYNNESFFSFDFRIEKPDFEILEKQLYPNPVQDILNIKFKHNRAESDLALKLEVFDFSGKLIVEKNTKCFKCASPHVWTIDKISSKNINKVFYRLTLESISEKTIETKSGSLIFWK